MKNQCCSGQKKNSKFKISFEIVYYSGYMRHLFGGINCHFAKTLSGLYFVSILIIILPNLL